MLKDRPRLFLVPPVVVPAAIAPGYRTELVRIPMLGMARMSARVTPVTDVVDARANPAMHTPSCCRCGAPFGLSPRAYQAWRYNRQRQECREESHTGRIETYRCHPEQGPLDASVVVMLHSLQAGVPPRRLAATSYSLRTVEQLSSSHRSMMPDTRWQEGVRHRIAQERARR
jgi:hypothetical protein